MVVCVLTYEVLKLDCWTTCAVKHHINVWKHVKLKKTLNNTTNCNAKHMQQTCRPQSKRDGKRWRTGGEMKGKLVEWVASTLHTISEHGVSSITTADANASAASSRLNWRPRRFKRTRPFLRKTKSGFWACAITFQTRSTTVVFPVKGKVIPLQA
jgi:hypothetical protein